MTSSPEQEIPQEVIDKAFEWTLDGGCIGIMDIGDPYYRDLRREIIAGLLAAVLPDLQRPLLEEIERLKQDLHTAVKRIGRLGKEIANLEEQRDARPDLTDDEKQVVIEALDPTQWKPPYDGVTRSARAKLERSLDAAG